MTTVVVADIAENADRNLGVESSILGPDVNLIRYVYDRDDEGLVTACQNADVILTDYVPIRRPIIARLEQCKLIAVAATGHNCVDLAAAADHGISVCAIEEYCTDEVADHAILLMLALCRRLTEYHDQVQTENRWQFDSMSGLRRLSDLTLGIIGFGRIGQAVARRARGFGLTTLAYDLREDTTIADELDVNYCDLDTLYAESDIISLHCELSSKNRQLIDTVAIRKMSRKPILINCARGGLVDEDSLLSALDSGQLAGAGLDVLSDESPTLGNSLLTNRHNVVITPHVAFYSDASILENRRVAASNIRNFLDNKHSEVRKYVCRAAG